MQVALFTFSLFMCLFLLIGVSSVFVRQKSVRDYLIGGRQMGPWLSALSAASTTCSGFMFIGLIGLSYRQGIYAFWFLIGITLGTLLVWYLFVPYLRRESERIDAQTYLQFLFSSGNKDREERAGGRWSSSAWWFAGLMTLIFLGLYAAAQLKAGTKALQSLFEITPEFGMIMSAGLILIYCLAGGYRASVWSDAAQSIVMFLAMAILGYTALSELGGWGGLIDRLADQDPALTQFFPSHLASGVIDQPPKPLSPSAPWWTGLQWTCLGIGCLGQPHIMIRPIALRSVDDIKKTRQIFFVYYTSFVALSIFVGVCARALIPLETGGFDAELALPKLASTYLSPALIGVILAGVFASTISTADSQILTCSAVIGRDLKITGDGSYLKQRVATVIVILGVLGCALIAPSSVFTVVILSWTALAVTFTPVIILKFARCSLYGGEILVLMLVGFLSLLACRLFIHPIFLNEILFSWLMVFSVWMLFFRQRR